MWDYLNELIGRKTCKNKLPTDIDANAVKFFFLYILGLLL